jgi:hypothetical protein
VNMQKPMCNDLSGAQRMLEAAKANGRILRVMENYLFYEPLRKLKAAAESGEIGEVCGYQMKMAGTGLGGWDVPVSSFEWQLDERREITGSKGYARPAVLERRRGCRRAEIPARGLCEQRLRRSRREPPVAQIDSPGLPQIAHVLLALRCARKGNSGMAAGLGRKLTHSTR